ncbi:MAG: hypothetical protein KDB72_18085 [Mycobacterium sp.]|nr:hypothetical protein [Mycobacterium sp.]
MTGLGRYLAALDDVATVAEQPRLARLVQHLRRPLRVRVRGRTGAGCASVSRALRRRGTTVLAADDAVDVEVHVLAETLKPEDAAALRRGGRPRIAVLNKADVCGFGEEGPLARTAERCRALQGQCGVEVLPLAALLAAADLDDDMIGALGVLADEPADLGSTDRFTAGAHSLSPAVRERLLAELDLFGIAHAVLAVRRGADRAAVNATLHRLSGVAAVLDAITAAGAPVRYRRILDAAPVLAELSAGPEGARVADGLASDEVVIARMAAAVEVLTAAGMAAAGDDTRAAPHLGRAVRWQRYAGGPLSPVLRACAADVVRGSLRLWAQAGGVAETAP